MVAKVSLALLLVIGPVFLGSLLFPPTPHYPINSIPHSLNHILTSTIFLFFLKLHISPFHNPINMPLNATPFHYLSPQILPPLFFLQTIIFLLLLFNIPTIPSPLTPPPPV
ncbi:type IV secretion system protein, partial [Neisseria sicca]|uniref:type IV secretion system protein n=1 Tax=Neisseria sicca TaxID=490 RepID=UPI0034D97734